MKCLIKICVLTVALFSSLSAFADKREIWHGWTDMPGIPCTKFETYRDMFGNRLPKFPPKTAPQEHHTKIYLDIPNNLELERIAKHCALMSVGVGTYAFLANPEVNSSDSF